MACRVWGFCLIFLFYHQFPVLLEKNSLFACSSFIFVPEVKIVFFCLTDTGAAAVKLLGEKC